MEEMTLGTILAVFEEFFGKGQFWGMVAVALLVTIGYVYVLVRDREMSMRKFLAGATGDARRRHRSGLVRPVDDTLGPAAHGRTDRCAVACWVFSPQGQSAFAILVYVAQSLMRGKQTGS